MVNSSLSQSAIVQLQCNQKDIDKLKDDIGKKLIIDTKINFYKGFKTFLEEFTILVIWSSALYKMNFHSMIEFLMILIYQCGRSSIKMKFLMNITSILLLVRLLLILSNMNQQLNEMPYPLQFQEGQWDKYGEWQFYVPWIEYFHGYRDKDQQGTFIKWAYWLCLYMFKSKQPGLMLDFLTIFLIFIYYQTCQFWALTENVKISLSKDTESKLQVYAKLLKTNKKIQNQIQKRKEKEVFDQKKKKVISFEFIDLQPSQQDQSSSDAGSRKQTEILEGQDLIISDIKSERSMDESIQFDQLEKKDIEEEFQIKTLVKSILHEQPLYRLYKLMQRFTNIYYSKIMLNSILILSIMSNTLFSLGYILVLCVMMYSNKMFLNVKDARTTINPILKNFVLNYMILEMVMQLLYQIPLSFLVQTGTFINTKLPQIIGLQQYYNVTMTEENPQLNEQNVHGVTQLWCKALVYFLICIQIQIISSKSFNRLNDYLNIGVLKGKAMTYGYNNKKIRQYFRYQQINLKKEQMMIAVKGKCDKWQELFEARQNEEEEKIGVKKYLGNGYFEIDDHNSDNQGSNLKIIEEDMDINDNQSYVSQSYMTTKKVQESVKTSSFHKSCFQSVNSDYLAVRKLSSKGDNFLNNLDRNWAKKIQIKQKVGITDEDKADKFYQMYREKKDNLSLFIKLYLNLRRVLIDPVLLVNDKEKIKEMLKDLHKGEIKIRSTIELAIIEDIKLQIQTQKQTFYHQDKETAFLLTIGRYLKLFQQMVLSNLEKFAYIFMIIATIVNPGILTLIYPFSIFGYALLEETRPNEGYWNFIMGYTQLLMVTEFIFSLSFWELSFESYQKTLVNLFAKYYIGLYVVQGNEIWDLFIHFIPKIMILFVVTNHIQQEVLLNLLEGKEQQKEDIKTAYARFIKGQFDVNIEQMLENKEEQKVDLKQELEDCVQEYEHEYWFGTGDNHRTHLQDDWYITYLNENEENDEMIDWEEIYEFIDDLRPYKSEMDIEFLNNESFIRQDENMIIKMASKVTKGVSGTLNSLFVKNHYINHIFPELKLQKPGYDFYSYIVIVQVFMCIFILLFYPSMDADSSSIVEQIDKNQFSGPMVIILTIFIIIMVIDRYIYKSKSFIEAKEKNRGDGQQGQSTTNLVKTQLIKGLQEELEQNKSSIRVNSHQRSQTNLPKNQKKDIDPIKLNIDDLLAKTDISFKSVMKYYFQWVTMIFMHGLLFFYLPISGNLKTTNLTYCDHEITQSTDSGCNDFKSNWYMICFYMLSCQYFWLSALQIKYGLPEVMHTFFMMGQYNSVNKLIFNVFMQIPFIFELRVFIDWTYTKTSLDVFQWVKLAKCQADFYKAKCINQDYFQKPIGERIPLWMKYLAGFIPIVIIVILIIGPMMLFSTFSFGSDNNPVSKSTIDFSLQFIDSQNQMTTYKLFSSSNIIKIQNNITQYEYDNMTFSDQYSTRLSTVDQIQYLILDSAPSEAWIASDPVKNKIWKQFDLALQGNDTEQEFPYQINANIQYSFTRTQPSTAVNPIGSQTFSLFNYSQNRNDTSQQERDVLQTFIDKLNVTTKDPHASNYVECTTDNFTAIQIGNLIQFQPVIALSDKLEATFYNDSAQLYSKKKSLDWTKSVDITYNPCQSYWKLNQILNIQWPEYKVFLEVNNITDQVYNDRKDQYGLSFFVISKKILPSYLNVPIVTFYISIIYFISKLFRQVFVPNTFEIFITDAKDPQDMLMLCEVIHLYRLKQMLIEEEELYFLLIDIMRAPQVFKAITSDSIKTIEKEEHAKLGIKQRKENLKFGNIIGTKKAVTQRSKLRGSTLNSNLSVRSGSERGVIRSSQKVVEQRSRFQSGNSIKRVGGSVKKVSPKSKNDLVFKDYSKPKQE